MKATLCRTVVITSWLLGLAITIATAQTNTLKITYPESRAVFQRANDNFSTIYLSGSYYQPIDSVQARLVAEVDGQGQNTSWATIQRGVQGGIFQGSIRGQAGWYQLQTQAFAGGKVVGTDVVRKVGIGEVFIITGQSNAQGFQQVGTSGAADDRVNCVAYDNYDLSSLADPPSPTFQQLSSGALIGPRGQSAWCWGILGDQIAKQYNCPVLFINTAWEGTSSKNWRESADGKPTLYWFNNSKALPAGMPYANLIIALQYYSSLQGLRAVLWQQGESDSYPLNTSRAEYTDNIQYLFNKTRADTQRYPSWMLARSSYTNGRVNANIISAQNALINTYNNNVYAGPMTDNIQIPRPGDDVHFGGDGLRLLALAWAQSMNVDFFSRSIPLPPLPQPTLSVVCNTTTNSGLTLTLPDGFKSYTWRNGQAGRTLTVNTPNTYQAILKDNAGNSYISPAVQVTAPIRPDTPIITLPRQNNATATAQQQICADSVLTLATNSPVSYGLQWSSGIANRSLNVGNNGMFSVQATNVYGCRSVQSAGITLTVRPRLATPTIAQVGPYSVQATLPISSTLNERFDWRQTEGLLPYNGATAKVISNGSVSARAKAVFVLTNSNSTSLTCYSAFSNAITLDQSANEGVVIYPNPSYNGIVSVETRANLPNADISVYSLHGQLIYQTIIPLLDERKTLDLSGLTEGQYIVKVRAAGVNVSKRIMIDY
jgi:Carbohydrate esterase, sialic acid-specific acetylesterase/Secretion system C-terminal sorting domain